MSSGLLDENMEELILVFEARAGYHRREVEQICTYSLYDALREGEQKLMCLWFIVMAQEDPDESLVERILEGLVEGIRRVNDSKYDHFTSPDCS